MIGMNCLYDVYYWILVINSYLTMVQLAVVYVSRTIIYNSFNNWYFDFK